MLRALGRGALRLIALGAETRELRTNEILFRPGERIDGAYVVQEGRFQLISDPDQPGTGEPIQVGPGAMLGEFAIFAEAAKPLSARALVPSVVVRIPRSMFLKILEDDLGAAMRLRDYIEHRARQSIEQLLEVRQTLDPSERQ